MDGRLTRTYCDEAGDNVVPNVLSPRDLSSRPDNMDETELSSHLCILARQSCIMSSANVAKFYFLAMLRKCLI